MTVIRKRLSIITILLLLAACEAETAGELSGSGVVEATEVSVSVEIAGQVEDVYVSVGEAVAAGDPLLRVQGQALEGQLQQAAAALAVARGNLEAAFAARAGAAAAVEIAGAGLAAAELQVQMTLSLARIQELTMRQQSWSRDLPTEFGLPPWYFADEERLEAAQAEVAAAESALQVERENLVSVIGADLGAAEQLLAESQAAFLVAEILKDRQVDIQDRKFVQETVDELHDAAEAELTSVQQAYENLLSDEASEQVLEARARVAVAEQRLASALDLLDGQRSGEHSLEVQAALIGLRQAELQLVQAEALHAQAEAQIVIAEGSVAQAETALHLVELLMEKLVVHAPIDGVVMTRTVQAGEIVQPGIPLITIAQLEQLRITVYLPEDRYGQVSPGDAATVSVDSYPEQTFEAVVIRVADEAEFTPRNVQTEEDRRSTVYAIELAVQDPAGKLKPGMPADVVFSP